MLYIYRDNVGRSTINMEILNVRGDGMEVVRQESVTPLDLLLRDGLLPPISFIKADVEGYERQLLLGAQGVIRRYHPCLSICTYHLPTDWRGIPKIIKNWSHKIKFTGGFFQHLCAW